MDRSEINRALAKCLAYKQCGQDSKADLWAARLVGLLESACILNPVSERVQEAARRDPS